MNKENYLNKIDNLKLEIEKYNKEIFEYENIRKENKEQSFKIIKGNIPIIFSAPHCVSQTRENKLKMAEGETGAIVQILAKDMNCYGVYKTYNDNDDANYDIEGNQYKEALLKLIKDENLKLLIDLHGAKNEHKFDIEICTDDGNNIDNKNFIIDILKKSFKNNGIDNITENSIFKASSIRTISKYIHSKTNIPCIQLEMTGRYRYIENIEGIAKLINGLEYFVNNINKGEL